MKIRFLYGSNSQPYETTLNEEEPISHLKSLIATHIGLEPDLQKWVYKGKILSEHQKNLLFYEFCDGDTIHVIKSVAKPSSSPPSPSLSSSTSSISSQPSPAAGSYPVPYFDQAMRLFLTHNSHEENVRNCLSTISKILSNIIDHPHDEKYRRIKNTNPHFQKKVGSQEGSQQLLQSLGFNLQGEEWILYPNAETWNTIVSCQQKLQKFLEKLTSSATIASPPSSSSPSSSASSSKGKESFSSFLFENHL